MKDRDNSDLWTALTIGAVVGIGAALLARSRQSDDDLHAVLSRLKPQRKRTGRALKRARHAIDRGARQAGAAGEDLVHASREVLDDLRKGARDIVQSTTEELRNVARDSIADARRAARKAARRAFR